MTTFLGSILIVIFMVSSVNAHAEEYFVDIAGSGDFTTIQDCADFIQAGDICTVHPGNYNERVSLQGVSSGNASQKIIFRAVPRRQATVKGFYTDQSDYLRIEGFNISNQTNSAGSPWGNANGIHVESDYVEIVDNYFFDIPASAIFIGKENATGIQVIDNKIYKCMRGIDGAARTTIDTLIQGNDIERLYAWDNDLSDIDHTDNDYIRIGGINTVIRGNHLHGTQHEEIVFKLKNTSGDYISCVTDATCKPPNTIYSSAWCSSQGECVDHSHCDGIELLVYGGRNLSNALVEGNIIEDAHSPVKSEMQNVPDGGVVLRNNVFQNMWGSGPFVFNVPNYQVYNNTFFNTGLTGFALREWDSANTNSSAVVKNNIFAEVARGFYVEDDVFPRLTETNNYITDADMIFSNNCMACQPDHVTQALFNQDPLFSHTPESLLFPIRMPAENELVLSGIALDPLIHVGDYLEYQNDNIVRTITGKSIVGGNIVLTYTPGVAAYQTVDFYLQMTPPINQSYFYLWKTTDFTLDLRLQSGSPAIDAGANLSGLVDTDIDGIARTQGSGWDVGAYEYCSTCQGGNVDSNSNESSNDSSSGGGGGGISLYFIFIVLLQLVNKTQELFPNKGKACCAGSGIV